LGVGGGLVAGGGVFGEVFGDVADAPFGVGRPGGDALGVDLLAEVDHMRRLRVGVGVDLVECLAPGG
jgi:hypothetical protein